MEEEFDKLYRSTSKELYWIAYALTKDQTSAENAVQEAFIYLWEHRGKLLKSSFVYPYLVKSVKSYALNYCRERLIRARHVPLIVYSALSAQEIDEEEYARNLELARKLLEELPERCREMFVKCVIEGMSYRECAEEMDISVNTVKFHVKAAYDKLRKAAKDNSGLIVLLLFSLYESAFYPL